MPFALCTLLKLPPSAQVLSVRQFSAMPLTPPHQKEEVTCWIQTLFTTQLVPLKSIAPSLLLPARLEELQSSRTFDSVHETALMILPMPYGLFAGVTR